ncbi:hypothetical protein Tco_1566401, partial [Tanacetum coccineum]
QWLLKWTPISPSEKRVHELYISREYEVNGKTSRFWIETGQVYEDTRDTGGFWISRETGHVYTNFPNEEDLVIISKKDYGLFNERKDVDLQFSILEETEKDSVIM